MKIKINKWGNSHGIRLSASLLEHLNVKNGNQIEFRLTNEGIELLKNNNSIDFLNQVKTQVLDDLIKQSFPVSLTTNPNIEAENDYIVIGVNPTKPIIREVEKGYLGAYRTLADAKYAARQLIQQSIDEAKHSLSEVRQIGIDTIRYIEL